MLAGGKSQATRERRLRVRELDPVDLEVRPPDDLANIVLLGNSFKAGCPVLERAQVCRWRETGTRFTGNATSSALS